MSVTNDIVLRPRFKIKIPKDNETVLLLFQNCKKTQSEFIVTRLDDHVFIKFPKHKQHFWSPQLHLEINAVSENSCILHGLFGPNPTVWTFFIFLHFFVAGMFIAFGIWAYTNWVLEQNTIIQISLMILMTFIWFTLYFAGRFGKATSEEDMHKLKEFMNKILNS